MCVCICVFVCVIICKHTPIWVFACVFVFTSKHKYHKLAMIQVVDTTTASITYMYIYNKYIQKLSVFSLYIVYDLYMI